jgi:hypothetical protein
MSCFADSEQAPKQKPTSDPQMTRKRCVLLVTGWVGGGSTYWPRTGGADAGWVLNKADDRTASLCRRLYMKECLDDAGQVVVEICRGNDARTRDETTLWVIRRCGKIAERGARVSKCNRSGGRTGPGTTERQRGRSNEGQASVRTDTNKRTGDTEP